MKNSKKSNQITGHSNRITDIERMKLLSTLRAGRILLTYRYLMEGLALPECELCHSHAKTMKYLLNDCANLASLRLRFFYGSNPKTLKQILGRNKMNLNTIKFLKQLTSLTGLNIKMKEKNTNVIQTKRTYLKEDWSLNPVIFRPRCVHKPKFFFGSCILNLLF